MQLQNSTSSPAITKQSTAFVLDLSSFTLQAP
jgi:hypothetical protein